MQNEKPDNQEMEAWHNDPSNWIWGLFYYNKKDKRIFPPKRLAFLGWTINFANPLSVLVFLSILLIILGLAGFTVYLQS